MKIFVTLAIVLLGFAMFSCGGDNSSNVGLPQASVQGASTGTQPSASNPLPKGVVSGIRHIAGINCEFEIRDINTNRIQKFSGQCNQFQIGDSVGLGAYGNGAVRPSLYNLTTK